MVREAQEHEGRHHFTPPAAPREPDPLLGRVIAAASRVIDCIGATVMVRLGGNDLELLGYAGPIPQGDLEKHWDLRRAQHCRTILDEARPVVLNDVRAPGQLEQAYRATAIDHLGLVPEHIKAWMGLPLVTRSNAFGILAFDSQRAGGFTPADLNLAQGFADQAAMAVENAWLLQQMQRAQRETQALAEIASVVADPTSLQASLDAIARRVVQSGIAGACALHLFDEASRAPRESGAWGLPAGFNEALSAAWSAGQHSSALAAFTEQRVLVREHLRTEALADPAYAPLHRFLHAPGWEEAVFLPLVYQGRSLGTLVTYHASGHGPDPLGLRFLAAVASQAATASENARLLATARDKAALEERQKLARDLHDSVSQALYGIALGARSAATALERNPDKAREPIEYVRNLAEAGITEMRALIFELRPESLAEHGLALAISKQMAALRARYGLDVRLELCPEPDDLPLPAKEALYRIAQEAAHNTVKHAQASRLTVRLAREDHRLVLEVSDDGRGFDPLAARGASLGQKSMRERAHGIGASLEVESAPGHGTRLRLQLPLAPVAAPAS